MKNILIALVLFFGMVQQMHGHNPGSSHSTRGLREWHLKNGKHLHAYYLHSGEKTVVLERKNGQIVEVPLQSLAGPDQEYVKSKNKSIQHLNKPVNSVEKVVPQTPLKQEESTGQASKKSMILLVILLLTTLIWSIIYIVKKQRFKSEFTLRSRALALVSVSGFLLISGLLVFARGAGSSQYSRAGNNAAFLDSAFTPFKPAVNTRWDNNYFYVESNGIPAHNMMVGITSWQQQVPLPQCYIGTNAWSIPLNPVMASVPVPVNNKHFLRGAIALAANGIPIFNPYTNTGVDAFLDGQLDQWGGHSGRADDYHYHTAPLFLEQSAGPITPIAFALDGHAVYGSKEPDGSSMKPLDANHGHWGADGRYHYHGTPAAPYMVGQMAGVVTEDTTLQIIPQPAAKGVRPALTPLKDAVITGFHSNGNNGYTLIYSVNGSVDSVVYSWTSGGLYTYDFYKSGVKTTSNYQGKAPCMMPSGTTYLNADAVFSVYPNPARDNLTIRLTSQTGAFSIQTLSVIDLSGRVVFRQNNFSENISTRNWPGGHYLVCIQTNQGIAVKRVLIQP
jgi:hypothetical protein